MVSLTEPVPVKNDDPQWKYLAKLLPSPMRQLQGKRSIAPSFADNLVCFSRVTSADLNRPQRGRALHHRCVLIFALETSVTVCVDDRAIRLHAGEGLLVLPFQFHDYVDAEWERLLWMFVTFEIPDFSSLLHLRFSPFTLDRDLQQAACELTRLYLMPEHDDLTIALFRVLLERVKIAKPVSRDDCRNSTASGGLLTQINQLAQITGTAPSVKEIAVAIGISPSHLRAKFRASCGISLGRHLHCLQIEKACGLLRLSSNRITEISELCGFSSVSSFSRAFRTARGVSPLTYRQSEGRPFTSSGIVESAIFTPAID